MWGFKSILSKILGSVFFLAGTFKLVDPVGTSLIVTEYFKFVGLHAMIPLSWWTGFILSLCETLLGAALVTGIRKKVTAIISGVFLLVFTVLTLALWIKNPDMDCGCFGEVIHLTHLQSLMKNVILDLLWIIAFIPFRNLPPASGRKSISFGICTAGICLFALYFAGSNPAADYTAMYPGAELFKPGDFLSENDPVLSICSADGEYQDSLAYEGPVMAVSIYRTDKIRKKTWLAVRSLCLSSEKHGFRFLLLMPDFPQELDRTLEEHTYTADRRVLMTLNRSNGGATYIQDGMIVKKWEKRRLPDFYTLKSMKARDATELMMGAETGPVIAVQAYLLMMFLIMLLI